MDGLIIVDKPSNVTSRDVVNNVSKILNTKKIGHTGTLDPLATGVLVLCIGKATKLVDVMTSKEKEYIAKCKVGILTDTLDIEGKIIEQKECTLDEIKLKNVLKSFIGVYSQEVPIYSAVKINGKKLYEYARNNEEIDLPKRNVEIKKIELLSCNLNEYEFKVLVSKGTYIRSLIKDINDKLGIIGVMSSLNRIKQGDFSIEDAYKLEDIKENKYKIMSINDVLKKDDYVIIDDRLYNCIKNGAIIDNIYNKELITFVYNDNVVAIYKLYEKDNSKMKPYKMFV